MKHLFISFILCTLTLSAFAQETDVNFALTANGATATATSGNPLLAMDDNTGTRWESEHKVDPQTFTIDLGQVRTFNTIQIVWEGAYGKTFTVSVSDDKETWTPVWTVEGQELKGFPYTQTQKIDKTTARYIQFHGTERGTGYGYSFWEFRVFFVGDLTLTTLEATPATKYMHMGEENVITVTAKDQIGKVIENAGEVTYTISPVEAGVINGNVFTPSQNGTATIVAAIGDVKSAPFEIVTYVSQLAALEAKTANGLAKVSEGITINIIAEDQYGLLMETPDGVTCTITPADAGTITNNVYTPAKVGSALIKVAIGEVEATPFEVFAYDGENAAASASKESSKVIAQSDINPEIGANNAYYAVDGNDATIWQGCYNGEVGPNTEEDRTFDAWFVVDLGAYYDVNMVYILFEGACSQMYHVDFSEDNVTWNTTYTYEGNAGINAHARAIYGDDLQNASNVRYVRFWSTKAATQWGLKMYEFKVYGKVMKEAALSDISVDEISAQKIISNGQLFLIRDGKLFNALGQSINQ